MKIIIAINEKKFSEIMKKIDLARKFLPVKSWIQLDVADGKFTKWKTWNRPEELKDLRLKTYDLKLNIEVHLMVKEPERVIKRWAEIGAKRIIFHIEAVQSLATINSRKRFMGIKSIKTIKELGIMNEIKNRRSGSVKIGLAINPRTPVKKLAPYLSEGIKFVQILAVNPGKSGQKFDKRVLRKIEFLKKNYPRVKIEVDGGINLETAKMCKKAGADILVKFTRIFTRQKTEIYGGNGECYPPGYY
ncbi:ribulose-phosphate 3-epimerase [Candidatus Wolfebacteria bacterium]|nr:ribulose-phosphate 3-epimerase [Candidatus Wolfebacteria bacterium]